MLSGLIVLFCAVTYVSAAARVYPYESKPAKYACQDGCYLSELKRVLPYNKLYYPIGKCEVFIYPNQTYWYSCGVIAEQPGCHVLQDPSQNYPECCSKVICDTPSAPPTSNDSPNSIEQPIEA